VLPISRAETRARLAADRARLQAAGAGAEVGHGVRGAWLWLHPSWQCVWLHRWSHHAWRNGHPRWARLLWHLNTVLTGADISPPADLGPGLLVQLPMGVACSGRAGRNLTLMACAGLGSELGRRDDIGAGPGLPVLGDDVLIEPHGGVLGPVRVGDRVHIASGMALTVDAPADCRVEWPAPRVVRAASSASPGVPAALEEAAP
jgi:serine O-acetyltransferase